jgi:hypothetical protein
MREPHSSESARAHFFVGGTGGGDRRRRPAAATGRPAMIIINAQ